jgi:RNA polymerase-binding transcription factor DksA
MVRQANEAELDPTQEATLKRMLLDAREALRSRHANELRSPGQVDHEVGDEGDEASRATAESTLVIRAESDYARLAEIEHALAKFETGAYGLDEETGEPIDVNRLLAIPWARFAAVTQEKRDRNR